jgi:hypothetical protein
MARADAPFGFMPYGTILRKQEYAVNAAATALFKYDMVKLAAGGDVDRATAGDGTGLVGSVVGLLDSTKVPTTYIANSGTGYAIVCDDPDQLYIAQEDLSGASLGLVDRFQNANIIVSTTGGNRNTGRSTMELDSTTSAEHNAQMKIIDVCELDRNSEAAHYRRWICRINCNALSGLVGASGI